MASCRHAPYQRLPSSHSHNTNPAPWPAIEGRSSRERAWLSCGIELCVGAVVFTHEHIREFRGAAPVSSFFCGQSRCRPLPRGGCIRRFGYALALNIPVLPVGDRGAAGRCWSKCDAVKNGRRRRSLRQPTAAAVFEPLVKDARRRTGRFIMLKLRTNTCASCVPVSPANCWRLGFSGQVMQKSALSSLASPSLRSRIRSGRARLLDGPSTIDLSSRAASRRAVVDASNASSPGSS